MENQALFSFLKKQHNLKMSLGQIKKKISVFRVTGLKFLGRVGTHFFLIIFFFLTEMPFKMLFFRKPEKY